MLRKISNDTLFKLLFHLLFWGFLLVFPFMFRSVPPVNIPRPPTSFGFVVLLNFSLLPVFFINSNFLIPRILHKKGVFYYVFSMFGLIFVSFFLLQFIKFIFLPNDDVAIRAIIILPLVMVTAISTGYGLLSYLNDQEKLKQAQEAERLQSELSFLRSQVSPHFMFNVLNGLVYLIHKNSPEAKTVVVKLADLMRYMLYESDVTKVSLAKEIDYLQNYIDLQKLRFGNDIAIGVEKNIEKGSFFIEPMLLIPFVENAFKHGIVMVQDPYIQINISQKNDEFLFSVENKIGQTPNEKKDKNSGIGLKNVFRRLELLYAQTHELNVEKTTQTYRVILRLKLKS